MAADLALFDWWRPRNGFRWIGARPSQVCRRRTQVPDRGGAQLFLAWAVENDELNPDRSFPLRDSPQLFRIFADLDPADLGSVRAFADQHGWLGLGEHDDDPMRVPDPRDRRDPNGHRLVRAEALAEWAEAIFKVRQAVDLLEAAEKNNHVRLRSWLPTVEDEWVIYRRSEGVPTRAVARKLARQWKLEDPEAFIRSHRPAAVTFHLNDRISIDSRSPLAPYVYDGDRIRAARFIAQKFINQGLHAHTSASLVFDPEEKTHRRHVIPRNLLGAIWDQTARMAEGGRTYRRCEMCRGWFVLSPEVTGGRADRTYCSDPCRHKAYRDRRQRARELHAGGMTPSKIARELDSDTQTVRGWLGANRVTRRNARGLKK